MDFEQQLHKAFAPCDPRPELRFTILARRSALVRSTGKRGSGSRTILFGSIVAVAAAAAMLAEQLMDQPATRPVAAAPAQESVPVSAGVAAELPPRVSPALESLQERTAPEVDPTSAPRSLNKPSRPDAGYYSHPGERYGFVGESFFTSVLPKKEEDRQGSINTIISVTGVDKYTADKFLDYIKDALDGLHAYQREIPAYMCKQRDGIETIKQLAALFTSVDEAVETRRSEMTRGSESVLGAAGMRNLEIYLSNREIKLKPHVERNEERLLESGKSLEELRSYLCTVK